MFVERAETGLPGCFVLKTRVLGDARGAFVKTFHRERFTELGLRTDWAEQYFSVSGRGVLRGLHFQRPPAAHAKLVYCVAGAVLDVVLDLRRGTPTYGRHVKIPLDAGSGTLVYIPEGLAHGFLATSEAATLVYSVTSVYSPEHDTGVRWDGAGIDWPVADPIVSDRDRGFPPLEGFDSPFDFSAKSGATR